MAIWIPLLSFLTTTSAIILVFLVAAVISGRRRRRRAIGFFHPYTNDGGGGERVLWCAVRALQDENPDLDCIIYSGDDTSPETLAARALDRFGVHLLHPPVVSHTLPVPEAVSSTYGLLLLFCCIDSLTPW